MSLSRALTIAVFLAGLAALGVLEWRSRRSDGAVPGFSALCGAVLGYRIGRWPVGRIAVLGFWWWLGWHFFAR
jgi:hypothetical protein